MTQFLQVKNLWKYQHYKTRRPPWIKLYQSLLDDYAFNKLPDATKFHFVGILLLASRLDNCLQADSKWLATCLHSSDEIDIKLLVSSGLLAPCNQLAIPA